MINLWDMSKLSCKCYSSGDDIGIVGAIHHSLLISPHGVWGAPYLCSSAPNPCLSLHYSQHTLWVNFERWVRLYSVSPELCLNYSELPDFSWVTWGRLYFHPTDKGICLPLHSSLKTYAFPGGSWARFCVCQSFEDHGFCFYKFWCGGHQHFWDLKTLTFGCSCPLKRNTTSSLSTCRIDNSGARRPSGNWL